MNESSFFALIINVLFVLSPFSCSWLRVFFDIVGQQLFVSHTTTTTKLVGSEVLAALNKSVGTRK
jgi:hypothetical protein